MFIGLHAGLSALTHDDAGGDATASVLDALGGRDGFAIDFVNRRMAINDAGNAANAFVGDPEAKLTVFGSDPYLYAPGKGLVVDAGRDFSVALSTALFPYNPAACTVYVKYRLNAPTSGEQRYIFMADNAGTDRFATYAVAGQSMRFVTGDGASAHITLTSLDHGADQEHRAVFGADGLGKSYVDDAGVHADDAGVTLAASTPAHVGIGGYNDRVLRVLDGHIAEIMVVCEEVALAERLSLELGSSAGGPPEETQPYVFDVLGARNGFAIDFVAKTMRINDEITPSNAYEGDPEARLTKFGSDGYEYDPQKGLAIDAVRDFSIAMATGDFPYNADACTVYAKYFLNAASSAEQRYLFMADNTGDDRFAMYAVAGQPFRFVTGDGAGPDIVLSSMGFAADTEYRIVFGADMHGKSFIDDDGVQTNSAATLAASVPAHVGIGGYNNQVLRVLDGHLAEIAVICEPVEPAARLTLDPFVNLYAAEGDSHTFNTNEATWGVAPHQFYGPLVAGALGARFLPVNHGWSGDSSAEMVFQLPALFAGSRPDIATIYAGANDGAIAIVADTVPTLAQFSVADAYKTRLEPGGFVVVNGDAVQIAARSGNLITVSPGLTAPPQAGDQVEIDTVANIGHWIDVVAGKGVGKIAVIGYHFMNFATGGDTPAVEHPTRAALRAKQAAAAASRGVPYVDTYTHMAGRITDGEVVQGDDLAWHVGIGNTHLNVAGEQAVADAVYDAFVALGWDQG